MGMYCDLSRDNTKMLDAHFASLYLLQSLSFSALSLFLTLFEAYGRLTLSEC